MYLHLSYLQNSFEQYFTLQFTLHFENNNSYCNYTLHYETTIHITLTNYIFLATIIHTYCWELCPFHITIISDQITKQKWQIQTIATFYKTSPRWDWRRAIKLIIALVSSAHGFSAGSVQARSMALEVGVFAEWISSANVSTSNLAFITTRPA